MKIPTKLPQKLEEEITDYLETQGGILETITLLAYQNGYEKGYKEAKSIKNTT